MADPSKTTSVVSTTTIETANESVLAPSKRNYSAHSNPVHITNAPSLSSRHMRAHFSLTSSEARNERRERQGRNTSRPLDITGFKHLLMLILVMGNFKMIWNDWSQFGFRDTSQSFGFGGHDLEMASAIFGTNMSYLPVASTMEKFAAYINEPTARRKSATFSLGEGDEQTGQSGASPDRFGDRFGNEKKPGDEKKHVKLNDGLKAPGRPHYESKSGKPSALLRNSVYAAQLASCLGVSVQGSVVTWNSVEHPLVATGCESNVIVTFFKIASYASTNHELRTAWVKHAPIPEFYQSGPVYPENLSLGNSLMFWASPTLVYQPVYPRRAYVRWSRISPSLFEIAFGNILIWVSMMQMGQPVLEHLVVHIADWRVCLEDYLTLASINIFIWLTGFVVLFHSTLNLAGEITRFSDRNFYSDWWNAGSVGTFWRDWNLPVSNYFRRHIYSPLRAAGYSRMSASNVVFLISALFHESLFGVGTHNFNGVAFLCMMVQPILILATEPLEKMRGRGTTVGNCVFWLAIMFGQPTAIVIYFLQWAAQHPQNKTISARWWAHMFD